MNTRGNGRRNGVANVGPAGAAEAPAAGAAGNQGRRVADEDEEEEEGAGLQNLFQEPPRNAAGAWTDAEIKAGSRAAAPLVTSQRATCLQACSKAIMTTPLVAPGLVFITVEVRNGMEHNVVWQILEFTEATQMLVAQRVSSHADNLNFPRRAMFSLSTVEVLVSPTLHFLDLMIKAMNPILAVAVARFPLPDKIIVPSGPKWNPLTFSLEFEVLRHDESWHSKLVVALPREEGPPAAAVTGENAEAGRRVARAVPTGTHHWYLCDESMLVGSRSEELVYSSMVFGGARSAPGAAIQLGIGLPLRMAPKEARNILSLRITSSLSFDTITDTELLAIRYGADKADMSRFHLGESARLAYRRVCNCQELLFRLFHLKPHVMAVWSAFAAQILDTIEHGEARFPGIASNGVINRYVEQVLQTFFAQLHSPGLSASGSDAALTLLRLDVTNDVFVRFQLDAELKHRGGGNGGGGGGGQKRPPPEEFPTASGAPPATSKKPREGGDKKAAFCFAYFGTDGCTRGSGCRFSHKKPTSEAEKVVIQAGVQQRNGTLRGDAF